MLHRVLRVPIGDAAGSLRLAMIGRIDTGVHISHRVAHLDVSDKVLNRCVDHMTIPTTEALIHKLKIVLPSGVVIHGIVVAPAGFDARFSTLERIYTHRVTDRSSEVGPHLHGCVLIVDEVLGLGLMNRATSSTIGLHDLGSLATPSPGGIMIRKVKIIYWRRVPITPLAPDGMASHRAYRIPPLEFGLVVFMIVAGTFAHNMVRSLVSSCIKVGLGCRSLGWFADKTAGPVHEGSSGPTTSRGLTLEHIAYSASSQLVTKAGTIRVVRTL